MALIECPECGKKFSDAAQACPDCGYPTKYLKVHELREQLTIVTADRFPAFAEQEWLKRCEWAKEKECLEARQEKERREFESKYHDKMAQFSAQISNLGSIIRDDPEKMKACSDALKNLGLFAGAKKRELREQIAQLDQEYKSAVSKLENVEKAKNDYVFSHDRKQRELYEKHSKQKGRIHEKYLTYTIAYSDPSKPKGAYKAYSAKDKEEFISRLQRLCVYKGLEEYTKLYGRTDLHDFTVLTGFGSDMILEEARALAKGMYAEFQLHDGEELIYSRPASKPAKGPVKPNPQTSLRSSDPVKIVLPADKKKDASVIGRGIAGAAIAGPAGAVVGALSAIDKNRKNER